jgi:hypothetical protein
MILLVILIAGAVYVAYFADDEPDGVHRGATFEGPSRGVDK